MITKQQRIERQKHLGSSDIPALFDCDPFRNSADVWVSKVYDLEESKTSESMEIGTALEPTIVRWIADKYEVGIFHDPEKLFYICEHNPLFACNMDSVISNLQWDGTNWIHGEPAGIEVKYTTFAQEWGSSGIYNDESAIPQRVYLQIQQQMLCTGFPYILVGVWIASHGMDRRHFKIYRDDKIIKKIEDYGTFWWNKYVIPKVKPPDSPLPSIDTLKAIKRSSETIIDLPAEATQIYFDYLDAEQEYKNQKETMKPVETKYNEMQKKLIELLGDNSAGRIGEGIIIRYDEIKRNGYTVKESSYRKLKTEKAIEL